LSDVQRNQGACATSLLLLISGWLSVFLWDSVSGCNELDTPSAVNGSCCLSSKAWLKDHEDGDQGVIALRACQAYAREISHWGKLFFDVCAVCMYSGDVVKDDH